MEDLKNECKWNRSNGIPGMAGSEKGTAEYGRKKFYGAGEQCSIYMKTDDMLYSGGNGTGLSFYIKYADGSTEDNPTVIAKGVDENGDEFEKTIHINKVNPKSATVVEMRALEAHMGVKKLGGFTSLPLETGAMGLNDRMDFMDMFQKKAAAYYQYSMQAYWDFMNKK